MTGTGADRPLQVRVAEALGWTAFRFTTVGVGWPHNRLGGWWGHHDLDRGDELPVPAYDTDWSAAGPLIERHRLDVYCKDGSLGEYTAAAWRPDGAPTVCHKATGWTPLVAVCHLLLALHAAGELDNSPPSA